MSIEVAAKALAIWAIILALAVFNGIFREAVLVPTLGDRPGLILSGVLLSLLILAATYLLLPWLGIRESSQLFFIGLCWLTLTIVFEFSFGLLSGKALADILGAYKFKGGNIWSAVLVVTAVAPWLTAKLRGWL